MTLREAVKSGFYQVQRKVGRWITPRTPSAVQSSIPIFALHSIATARSDMAVSPAKLHEQFEAVLAAGYRPISIDQLLSALSMTTRLNGPSFAVTFDDGYRTVLTDALPILEKFGIPATVFLTSGFLDRKVAPPWRSNDAALLREYKEQAQAFEPLNWDQARKLAQHPLIRIGSHTHTHPLLGLISADDARRELLTSKGIIRDRLGIDTDLFAYPYGVRRYGAYSEATEGLVRELGYTCSMTSEIVRARIGNGAWSIPRISLTEQDEAADAVAKASGGYDWVAMAQSCYQSIFPNPHVGSN